MPGGLREQQSAGRATWVGAEALQLQQGALDLLSGLQSAPQLCACNTQVEKAGMSKAQTVQTKLTLY